MGYCSILFPLKWLFGGYPDFQMHPKLSEEGRKWSDALPLAPSDETEGESVAKTSEKIGSLLAGIVCDG